MNVVVAVQVITIFVVVGVVQLEKLGLGKRRDDVEKLKWKYDKKFKQWWVNIGTDDGFVIHKEGGLYALVRDSFYVAGRFTYLKNAKTVAQLLYNG